MMISQHLREWCIACALAPVFSAPTCSSEDAGYSGTPQSPPDASTLGELAAWNRVALSTTAAGPFSPPRESRTMAIMSIAVFDAINSITGRYGPFAVRVVADPDASTAAATVTAAARVLSALYPAAADLIAATADSALGHISPGRPRDAGIAAGEGAAAAVLALRSSDGITAPPRHAAGRGVGAWTPTPPNFAEALEPAWGLVRPFSLASGTEFRPPPPPAPGSDTYVRDYLEVVAVGSSTSTTRTAPQSEAAHFWRGTPQLWNQVVRQLTIARAMDPTDAARAYLLLNVAGADAMIAAWDAKFAYSQWRPVTAIRTIEDDDSPVTAPDTAWSPLLPTPPFPDYPAGHTSYAGAAEVVLAAVFGEQSGGLAITSPTADGATHQYGSFREIAEEVSNARVWAGVHWRTSSEAGTELGRKVGARVLDRAPRRRLQ